MLSTTHQIGSALKTFAKVGGAVIFQIFLFTAVGIILNIILTLFLIPEIGKLGSVDVSGNKESYTFWQKVKTFIPLILLFFSFLLLFPVLYFFVGKKQGIKAAISKLVHEKGDGIVGFIVSKFTDRMANNPEWKTSIQKNGIVKTVRNAFPGFIRTLQGLPWILKRPLKIVFETIDFAGAVEQAYKTRPDAPINSPETNQHITEIIATKLKLKFQPPKGKLLLTMVIVNIVLMFVVKIIV